jgi:hypothetical protein
VDRDSGFRARRARWRLRGAWTWPVFAVATLADALLLYLVPPLAIRFNPFAALIIASFTNLFLVGAVAPWIGGRLADRERLAGGSMPREVHADRAAVGLLLAGVAAVLAAGLGSRPLVVSETERTERLGQAVRDYVADQAPAEVQRNLDTANTRPLDQEGFFRTCIALDDRTRAYCLFVDTETRPPTISEDTDQRPNPVYFGE